MEQAVLNDKAVKPDDQMVFRVIGKKELLWKQMFEYLHYNSKDITAEWKYYNDIKGWLLQVLKKKKTLIWIRVFEDSFRTGFWFSDKLEAVIFNSTLPAGLKTEFKNARSFSKSRCISVNVNDSKDFENVKKLIDLKLKY